jgi:type II secretory pathway pseudopilin PulG
MKQSAAGFTVLELMVATSVFAVVMLVLTAGVLAFSRDYFRSINQSNTQATARNIMNDIVQNIEFGNNLQPLNPNNPAVGVCVDQTSYSYAVGYEVVESPSASDQLRHGLVKASGGDCGGISTAVNLKNPISASVHNQQELLGDHMRLGDLTINPLGGGAYAVHVRVIYGDSDVLTSPNGSDRSNVTCQGGAGSQFCAVSDLTTTVQTRLGSN